MRGNQGRSAGATTQEGGGMPVGNEGDVLYIYVPVVGGNAPKSAWGADFEI